MAASTTARSAQEPPEGAPTWANFELRKARCRARHGEVLLRTRYLSLAPICAAA